MKTRVMLPKLRHLSCLAACLLSLATILVAQPGDPDGRALLQAAQRVIAGYHDGHRGAENVLRVVYFHPSDRDPLPDYATRLDRVMNDVSDFYRDGFRRFGIEIKGLPLERKDGRLALHVVRGKKPASGYGYESGGETAAEVRAAMHDTFDLDREYVLIVYGLSEKQPDGRYIFTAPYYGDGTSDQSRGLCHAGDCEFLDPRLLTETRKKIAQTDHYYPLHTQTIAAFNSWYLGGLAHELGHGLGLEHNGGSEAEQRYGVSLMGDGNHTYREEVWSGGHRTIVSRASALQLASHPLFTDSNRGRWDAAAAGLRELTFSADGGGLQIRGTAEGEIPAYAVVASVWPLTTADESYFSRTFPVVLSEPAFRIALTGLRRVKSCLELVTLHVNGSTTRRQFQFDFDRDGRPDVAALNTASMLQRAEAAVAAQSAEAAKYVSDEAITRASPAEAQHKLRLLREVLEPRPPVELATVTANQAYLSDVMWLEAKVGWGQPARNHYWFDDRIQDGVFLTLGGQFFDKGLFAHASSLYAFALDGKWKTFSATIGLRDGANPRQGSAVFTVRGDGRELYRSPILRPGSREDVKVDVTDVQKLELLADGGEGHNFNSWAIWAAPLVSR